MIDLLDLVLVAAIGVIGGFSLGVPWGKILATEAIARAREAERARQRGPRAQA